MSKPVKVTVNYDFHAGQARMTLSSNFTLCPAQRSPKLVSFPRLLKISLVLLEVKNLTAKEVRVWIYSSYLVSVAENHRTGIESWPKYSRQWRGDGFWASSLALFLKHSGHLSIWNRITEPHPVSVPSLGGLGYCLKSNSRLCHCSPDDAEVSCFGRGWKLAATTTAQHKHSRIQLNISCN